MTQELFAVEITDSAFGDLDEIREYLMSREAAAAADAFIDSVLQRTANLDTFPMRGSVPRELEGLGRDDVRQIVMPPYRIIYTVADRLVTVQLVADGRRDMRTLLSNRLLLSTERQ
jgi:toxin ParE1/3/4